MYRNEVTLKGWIKSPFVVHHTMQGVEIYQGFISTVRLSYKEDIIPVQIIRDFLDVLEKHPEVGDFMEIRGAFHSRSVYGDDFKKHLHLYVQANRIQYIDIRFNVTENVIILSGKLFACDDIREKNSEKRLINFRVSTVRHMKRVSQIPCIAWDDDALYMTKLSLDDEVNLKGRIQSREYVKFENGIAVPKIVYEVSVTEFL